MDNVNEMEAELSSVLESDFTEAGAKSEDAKKAPLADVQDRTRGDLGLNGQSLLAATVFLDERGEATKAAASQTLNGNARNNALNGGVDDDTLRGNGGDDQLRGGGGDDNLGGGAGNDLLRGGAGNDLLRGGSGDDELGGGAGEDSLRGGAGDDALSGGAGDDQLRGGAGDDELRGGAGNDQVRGGSGNDQLRGGAGDDELTGGGGDDAIAGGAGDDELRGGGGDDLLRGNAGDDLLRGGDGADELRGGTGNDTLIANLGDDDVTGGGGNDLLIWNNGDGSDLLDGGSGNDRVQVNFQQNTDLSDTDLQNDDVAEISDTSEGIQFARVEVNGQSEVGLFQLDVRNTEVLETNFGGGIDTARIIGDAAARLALELDGGAGDDTADFSASTVGVVVNGEGSVTAVGFESIIGSDLADQITGDVGENFIEGKEGNDVINGFDASDLVLGGNGDDTLLGNLGNDDVFGGGGQDLLIWNNGDGSDLLNGGNGDDQVQVNFQQNTDLSEQDLQNDDVAEIADTDDGIQFNRVAVNGQSVNGLFQLDIEETETLNVNFGGGTDVARIIGAAADNIALVLDGGDGIDTLDLSQATPEVNVDLAGGTLETGTATGFENVIGTAGDDNISGDGGVNDLAGGDGDDFLFGAGGADILTGGAGQDTFAFNTGDQASLTDFQAGIGGDIIQLDDLEAFQTSPGGVNFAAIDATAALDAGAAGDELNGANVIAVLSVDDDDDVGTAFNARSAAAQIAQLTDEDEGGFFVYFNSGLGVNRLVFSENLNDGDAGLQVVARFDDTSGSAADTAEAQAQLETLTEDNFAFDSDFLL